MDKSPISLLQEIGMKLGTLPSYTELSATTATHQNKFTARVVWKNYNTEDTASTKKEAKHNAAKKMLLLLLSSKEIPESMLLSLAKPYANTTLPTTLNSSVIKTNLNEFITNNTVSSENIVKSLNTLSISDSDTKEEFKNYIGLLNEYCQQRNLPAPIYENVASAGPSHLPHFTVSCTAGHVQQEGTASTKKIAKHNAAKKVLENLQSNTALSMIANTKTSNPVDNLNVQFMDFTITQPKYDEAKKTKVITTYGQLRQKPILIQHVKVENYIEVLSNLCHNIPVLEKNSLRVMYGTHISKDPDMLKNIIHKAFKINIQEINFNAVHGKSAVGFKLNTSPVIFQFGIGVTKEQARINASYKLLEYIFLFLK